MSSREYIRSITDIIPDKITEPVINNVGQSTTNNSSNLLYFSWQTWIIIILLLALLGINIFAFLAKGTQETANILETIFAPILKLFGYTTLTATQEVVDTSATGAKAGIDIVAGAATGAIDTVQQTVTNAPNQQQRDSLNKALNDSHQQQQEVRPDDSKSSIQKTGKSGWCYIGESDGIRTCAEIGVNDTCMSGDIFPNQSICMNPKLRV